MAQVIRPALSLLLLFTALLGFAYPAAVTGVARLVFARQASGSVITVEGQQAGSALIGQRFTRPEYFWGRPSATSPRPYNAAASAASNLAPSSPALREAIAARVAALHAADPGNKQPIPVDLVTTSGSGLDPHISPGAAFYQIPRVARLRGLTETGVRELVETLIDDRTSGLFAEPRVNVLLLNLALDRMEMGRTE